ncbi:MAG: hypothetical protein ACXABY_34780 [Candidatus Thorarchaeota archaeon]|jgi:hypothetical protein
MAKQSGDQYTVSLQWGFYGGNFKSVYIPGLVEEQGGVLALDNPEVSYAENLLEFLQEQRPGCFDDVSFTRVELRKQGSYRLFFESGGAEYKFGFEKGSTQFTGGWPPEFNKLAIFASPGVSADKKGKPSPCEFSAENPGGFVAVIHNPTRP